METIIATFLAALLACCWGLEIRTLNKVRDGHSEQLARLRKEHEINLQKARNSGWLEGVDYQRERMTRKRDKAGRFA